MDLEEELDTHICLKCQKTIIGLDNYVAHKRTECPSLTIKSGAQDKSSESIKESTESSENVHLPTLIASEPSCQLKSDDFFFSLELKSSRVVEQKPSDFQSDKYPKNPEVEGKPAEELIVSSVSKDCSLLEKNCRSEHKSSDFMSIGGEDDDGECEDDDDFYDDWPPRGHTGGKWKPGMRPENPASWLSNSPDVPNSTGVALTQSIELEKKRTRRTYSRGTSCKCGACNITFTRESDLVTHLASAEHWHKSGTHPLHQHLILSHSEILAPLAPFKCAICAFYFNEFNELVNHWAKEDKTHQAKVGQYRQFLCTLCKYRCWTNDEMLEHLNSVAHVKEVSCWNPLEVTATSELCCSKCNWTCGRQQALFSHMRWKHSENIHCAKCRINFASEAALDRHNLLNEHTIGESKSTIAAHLEQEHLKTVGKGGAVKLSRGRPSLEELKKSKSNEESKEGDAKQALEKADISKILATLKPMPLSEKKYKCLNLINASHEVIAKSTDNNSQIREKMDEMAADDKSVLSITDVQVKSRAKSKDHTYYEVGISSRGKKETGFNEDCIVKQENLNESLIKRKRSKVCPHCNLTIADMKHLRIHLLEFHSDKLISCEPCCATFVFKSEYDSHLKGFIHRCNTKDLREASEGLINPVQEFVCSQCTFHSSSKSGIIFHEMLHPPKTEAAISALEDAEMDVQEEVLCVEEDQVGKADAMTEVVITMDVESDGGSATSDSGKLKQKPKRTKCKLLICPICKKGFSAPNLRDHLNIHTGEKPFVCSICNACFAVKGSLASHRRSQHGEKQHACPHCSYRSNRKAKLSEHLTTHEDRVRECTCDICGAGFYKSSALQSHMRIHSDNKGKRVACGYEGCNKAFRTPSELVYHYRVHTGDRPFLCETCGYSTKSRHQLTKHERSHNGIKPFKCNYCSYSCSRSAQLRRHNRIHSCTKPYSCPHCSYTSSNQENLRKHVLKSKKHAGLSVYPCRHCSFGCNTANEMRDHMIAQHPAVAKLFDTEAPAFASLVTGIYNQKCDVRAPVETPAPYVPLTEKRDLYKNLHSKLQAKVDNYNLDGEMEEHSKHLDENEDEGEMCEDETGLFVRVVTEEQVVKANSEQNEVSTAVEYLMESTKKKGQTENVATLLAETHCNIASDSKDCKSKNDDASNSNSQLYQLLNQDAPHLYKQENAVVEEPLHSQNQIAIFAIQFQNDQAVEQVISSDVHEETRIKENTATDEQQQRYHPNTIILPYNAIEPASTTESEDQTVTIIQDPEHFHAMTGTNSDGETVILYMPVL